MRQFRILVVDDEEQDYKLPQLQADLHHPQGRLHRSPALGLNALMNPASKDANNIVNLSLELHL